ncbi:GFA family protein [Streptococcus danieliae]|uniref:GFA family protein n=1 Tax=Streptococcus danieliae TaxID=747656 RepID=A0A7Z0M686_9STRE|nr:GFA family protein [Streptococcus danieliae]NYS96476.1 GFA family protein [Streptococcus danieliae]
MILNGSCLCGRISYRISCVREDAEVILCFCSVCRKANGSAFSANLRVRLSDFELESGEESLTTYSSSPGKIRVYCAHCHSPLYHIKESEADYLTVKLGTLDSWNQTLSELPRREIFKEEALPWL